MYHAGADFCILLECLNFDHHFLFHVLLFVKVMHDEEAKTHEGESNSCSRQLSAQMNETRYTGRSDECHIIPFPTECLASRTRKPRQRVCRKCFCVRRDSWYRLRNHALL